MSTPPLLNGPIPPYTNPPIEPQFYMPSRFEITNISLGSTTIITTSTNHNYVIGQLVRLLVPSGYGCNALNNQLGYVISIPSPSEVEVNINSLNITPFINANLNTVPQIVAVGDINTGQINSSGLLIQNIFIPGSFQDISPL